MFFTTCENVKIILSRVVGGLINQIPIQIDLLEGCCFNLKQLWSCARI